MTRSTDDVQQGNQRTIGLDPPWGRLHGESMAAAPVGSRSYLYVLAEDRIVSLEIGYTGSGKRVNG